MKKIIVIAVCLTLAASVWAQDQVLSKNAVGYVKVAVPSSPNWGLFLNNFNPMNATSTTVSQIMSDQVPVGTKVYVWDLVGQTYRIATFLAGKSGNTWTPDYEIAEGAGFFAQAPATEATTNYPVFILGEVPDDSAIDVGLKEGFNLIGYMFPVDQPWTNMNLAKSADVGDKVYVWTGYGYDIGTFLAGKSGNYWSNPNAVLSPGAAFFYSKTTAGGKTWSETKPYTWP